MNDAPQRLEAISTRWSLLRQAREGSAVTSGEARNALVLRYLPAVRRYVGGILRNPQDADDATQDILMRLLAGDFAGADPGRGRFRDLLKTAIRNMVRNFWSRQKRRRGADFDVAAIAGADDSADEAWTAQWRTSVLDLAWNALELEDRRQGGDAYVLLRLRAEHPDDTSEQLAARFTQQAARPLRADALRQKLRRARLRFVDLLIAEIAAAIDSPTPEKIEDELVALGLIDLVRDLLPEDWKESIKDSR